MTSICQALCVVPMFEAAVGALKAEQSPISRIKNLALALFYGACAIHFFHRAPQWGALLVVVHSVCNSGLGALAGIFPHYKSTSAIGNILVDMAGRAMGSR